MFKHEKQYLNPVRVDRPNPNYAALLQEQLGGPQGELKAALQYLSQSMRIKDKEIKDLVPGRGGGGALPSRDDQRHRQYAQRRRSRRHERHGGERGSPCPDRPDPYARQRQRLSLDRRLCQRNRRCRGRDILSDIAAEQRAKVVYEYLYRQIDDQGGRETIDFLLNREEAHNTMFREAFNRIQDTGSQKDWGTTHNARIYFDLSGPGGQSFDPAKAQPASFNI